MQETLDASLDASLDATSETKCQAKVEVDGRHGVGVKNRGFLALGVGTGHDQVRFYLNEPRQTTDTANPI